MKRPRPALRLVVSIGHRKPFTIDSLLAGDRSEPHSEHCPSIFDLEAVRPDSICWSDLHEGLAWLEESGVVVRKPGARSGFAPMALEPLLTRRAAAARLKR